MLNAFTCYATPLIQFQFGNWLSFRFSSIFFFAFRCLVCKHVDWAAWNQTQSSWVGHTVGDKANMIEHGKHFWIRAELLLHLVWHLLFRKASISSQIQLKRFFIAIHFVFVFVFLLFVRSHMAWHYMITNLIYLDQRFHRYLVDCSRWGLIDVVAVLVETTSHMEEL